MEQESFFKNIFAGSFSESNKTVPNATLGEDYEKFIETLPIEVQEDVARYKNIFRENPQPIFNFLDEYKAKGFSDYIEKETFKKDGTELAKYDEMRFSNYEYLGKSEYDRSYRQDEDAGKLAQQKVKESTIGQVAVGVPHGLYTSIKGIAELGGALSDLYLDTDTLAIIEEVLPQIDLDEVYTDESGSIAKLSSLFVQYGTAGGLASKLARRIVTRAAKNKKAQLAAQKVLGKGDTYRKGIAKFGGYYALPIGAADAIVSAQGQESIGTIFGDKEGNKLEQALYSTAVEETKNLQGKEKAAAILRNKLKFGVEGTTIVGGISLLPPVIKGTAKTTGALLRYGAEPVLNAASKILTYKEILPSAFRNISKGADKVLAKTGIPKYDSWKFNQWNTGVKAFTFRGLDEFVSKFRSGGKFDDQTRNELKKVEGLVKSSKKEFDIFSRDLDREMYKLVNAGFSDQVFSRATTVKAMSYWDDVIKVLRGDKKIDEIPNSLRTSTRIIKELLEKQQEQLKPILKDLKVKDDSIKNMGQYLNSSYEIFKNARFRAPKKDYRAAVDYFIDLQKKAGKAIPGVAKGSRQYNELIEKDAYQLVNKILSKGRYEGSTPAERLKAIVNVMEGGRIPKNTFKKFFTKERLLPDEVAKLLGRIDDPKQIILDTISEQAHQISKFNAYKEIASFGRGKFLFKDTREFQDFLIKNGIKGSREITPVNLKKPFNVDLNPLFKDPQTGKQLLTLPELNKAMQDTTVFADEILKIPFMKPLLAIKAAVQMNKTVLSLMTQMRNITTAAMFATANGHMGKGASVSDNFGMLFKDLIGKTKSPQELRNLIKEALDNGAIDSSTVAQELQQVIPELMGGSKIAGRTVFEGKTSDQIFSYLFTNKGAIGKGVQKAIEAYQMGDNLWKLYGYQFTKSQLAPAIKNMNDVRKYFREVEGYEFRPLKPDGTKKTLQDAIKEIAGVQIRDTYPNYSMIPSFVLNVRKFPLLGNFVAFVSEMYRNSFQIMRRGLREMKSSNPYIRQNGARRLIGYTTTVGVALPFAVDVGSAVTEISKEKLQAYRDRFAPEYEKGHYMVPVEEQNPETKAWKSTDMSTMVPYADVVTPFKVGLQEVATGKNTDQSTLDLYGTAIRKSIMKALEPFLAPSIAAETALELTPNAQGQFKTKQGSLIADWNNDADWINKITYHAYKKLTPTTIRSAEEIFEAIGGDLSKAGTKRDLYDTVLKVLTGFGIRRQDPKLSFRFNLGKYSGELSRIQQAFTTDVVNASKLQKDARLIARGLEPETLRDEYEKQQKNRYRVMSEIRKDVLALRTIGLSDVEIAEIMQGRRAVSKKDIGAILKGFYNPSNIPSLQRDSGIIRVIKQINTELGTKYTPLDFFDFKKLSEIQKGFALIPLGLSEQEFEEAFRTTIKGKIEDLKDIPNVEPQGGGGTINNQQSSLIEQTPAAPIVPMPNIDVNVAQINPQSGLTRTQEALLSPDEKVIASNRNKGIMGLV